MDDLARKHGAAQPVGNNVPGQFRFDINGLRAIAVLGVLLFHFDIPYFGGGFAGVDVFFVISGFLMTQIILGRPRKLGEFYIARMKRLVPALVVMLATFLLLGLVVIDPMTLDKMAGEALAALIFVSNFFYFFQGDYFAPAAEENWFLHNWSLSVEWQFFALYPIFLGLIVKFVPRWVAPAILIGCLASLALAVGLPLFRPWTASLAFYMLPTRLWELLVGGLVYCYAIQPNDRMANVLHFGGLAVIAASFLFFDATYLWPFGWAVIPVLGTAMVIAARVDAGWTRRVTEIGLASYSTYLWHWPIIVLLAYFSVERSLAVDIALVAFSLLLGSLSYRWFEQGLRRALFAGSVWKRAVPFFVVTAALVVAIILTRGLEAWRFEARHPGSYAAAEDLRQASTDWVESGDCRGDICIMGEDVDTLVIGDSHAEMYRPLLAGTPVAVRSAQGCLPLPALERTTPSFRCAERVAGAFELAQYDRYRRIVFIASWSDLFTPDEGAAPTICDARVNTCVPPQSRAEIDRLRREAFASLEAEIAQLRRSGKTIAIVLLSPVARQADSRRNYRRLFETGEFPAAFDRDAFLAETAAERAALQAIASRQGIELIDPVATLCDATCPVVWRGRTLYRDTNHFRGSSMDEDMFARLKREILGPSREIADTRLDGS